MFCQVAVILFLLITVVFMSFHNDPTSLGHSLEFVPPTLITNNSDDSKDGPEIQYGRLDIQVITPAQQREQILKSRLFVSDTFSEFISEDETYNYSDTDSDLEQDPQRAQNRFLPGGKMRDPKLRAKMRYPKAHHQNHSSGYNSSGPSTPLSTRTRNIRVSRVDTSQRNSSNEPSLTGTFEFGSERHGHFADGSQYSLEFDSSIRMNLGSGRSRPLSLAKIESQCEFREPDDSKLLQPRYLYPEYLSFGINGFHASSSDEDNLDGEHLRENSPFAIHRSMITTSELGSFTQEEISKHMRSNSSGSLSGAYSYDSIVSLKESKVSVITEKVKKWFAGGVVTGLLGNLGISVVGAITTKGALVTLASLLGIAIGPVGWIALAIAAGVIVSCLALGLLAASIPPLIDMTQRNRPESMDPRSTLLLTIQATQNGSVTTNSFSDSWGALQHPPEPTPDIYINLEQT
ncbi:hypothetical protein AB1K70_03380 [Bremerella sp. JC770]|uniref:hypothetical protein n=1 Tax=Bremerella sp. JC770 TaxID=3232137 RepID=UPI0034593996